MSTTTAIKLDADEIEALRDAAFDAMECYDGGSGFDPSRPADNAEIPVVMRRTNAMVNDFAFYARVLYIAERGVITPESLGDFDLIALTKLLESGAAKLSSRIDSLEGTGPLENTLEGCHALLAALRAEGVVSGDSLSASGSSELLERMADVLLAQGEAIQGSIVSEGGDLGDACDALRLLVGGED